MNWKLIFLLSLFGLAMGFATVFVIPSSVEPFCWLAIFIVCAYLIARYAPGKYFLHGLSVGIANGIWMTAIHASLFYTYVANHPEYLQMLTAPGNPEVMAAHPRRMMVITGPIIGVLSGLVIGLFSWVASRFVKSR